MTRALVKTIPTDTVARTTTELQATNWTRRTTPADNAWQAITWGNEIYVAVANTGTGNRAMYSTDGGITWVIGTSASDVAWSSVAYGNNTFVAVSYTGTAATSAMTSTNGSAWTIRNTGQTYWYSSIAYSPTLNLFAAASANTSSAGKVTTPDGITWTARGLQLMRSYKIAWLNDKFILFYGFSASTTIGQYSTDGVTWNNCTCASTFSGGIIYTAAYGNGIYMAVGNTGTNHIIISTDGINWNTATSFPTTFSPSNVVFANGVFIAIGTNPTLVFTSVDGVNWKQIKINTKNAFVLGHGIIYNNSTLVGISNTDNGFRALTSLTYTS